MTVVTAYRRSALGLATLLAATTALCAPAVAQVSYQNGDFTPTTPKRWNEAGNWQGGVVPDSDTAVATFGRGDLNQTANLLDDITVNRINNVGGDNTIGVKSTRYVLTLGGTAPQVDVAGRTRLTFDLDVTAASRVEKTGDGRLALAESETLTGAMLVQDGTLEMGKQSAVTGRVTVAEDAFLETDFSPLGNPSAARIGSLEGTGTVTLQNGGLAIGTDGTNSTFAGLIQGSGNVRKVGDGTLTLTGANTVGGDFYLEEGTLSVGNDTALSADNRLIVGEDDDFGPVSVSDTRLLAAPAAPTLDLKDGVDVANTIELRVGTANINQTGGSATLSGNIYENVDGGATLVKTGSGEIDLTGISDLIEVQSVAIMDVPAEEMPPVEEPVVDVEPLIPAVRVSRIEVQDGLLSINTVVGMREWSIGRVALPLDTTVTVADGGTLGGAGTIIGDVTVQSGGRLAPGNSVGTLTVDGDTTFEAGSTFAVELDADGTSDLLAVGGVAALDGTVAPTDVDMAADYATPQTYTILTAADGVTGTFTGVTEDAALVEYTLVHGEGDVQLIRTVLVAPVDPETPIDPETPVEPGTPGVVPDFGSVAEGDNNLELVLGLGGYGFAADPAVLNNLLPLNAADLNAAYAALGGQIHAEVEGAVAGQSASFAGAMLDQLGAAAPAAVAQVGQAAAMPAPMTGGLISAASPWISLQGLRYDVDGDGNASGFDSRSTAIAGGVVAQPSAMTTVGFALGYTDGALDLTDIDQSAEADGFHIGAFGSSGAGRLEAGVAVRGALAYGRLNVETRRTIAFGNLNRTATAEMDADALTMSGEVRYQQVRQTANGTLGLAPFARIDLSRVSVDSFAETGAGGLNLSGQAGRNDRAALTLGVAVDTDMVLGSGRTLQVAADIGVQQALANTYGTAALTLDGSPTGFTVRGVEADRTRLLIGADATYALSDSLDLTLSADGSFAEGSRQGALGAALNFSF